MFADALIESNLDWLGADDAGPTVRVLLRHLDLALYAILDDGVDFNMDSAQRAVVSRTEHGLKAAVVELVLASRQSGKSVLLGQHRLETNATKLFRVAARANDLVALCVEGGPELACLRPVLFGFFANLLGWHNASLPLRPLRLVSVLCWQLNFRLSALARLANIWILVFSLYLRWVLKIYYVYNLTFLFRLKDRMILTI